MNTVLPAGTTISVGEQIIELRAQYAEMLRLKALGIGGLRIAKRLAQIENNLKKLGAKP